MYIVCIVLLGFFVILMIVFMILFVKGILFFIIIVINFFLWFLFMFVLMELEFGCEYEWDWEWDCECIGEEVGFNEGGGRIMIECISLRICFFLCIVLVLCVNDCMRSYLILVESILVYDFCVRM